jgi:hypothetical protein
LKGWVISWGGWRADTSLRCGHHLPACLRAEPHPPTHTDTAQHSTRTRTCAYTHVCIHTHPCAHRAQHTHTHSMCTHTYTCLHTHVHTHTCIHTHTCAHTAQHTHKHPCAHTYMCIHSTARAHTACAYTHARRHAPHVVVDGHTRGLGPPAKVCPGPLCTLKQYTGGKHHGAWGTEGHT